MPNSATLNGSITDDGLPSPPAQTSVTWSKVSGSGTVTFSSPSTAVTSATFSQAGTYVLRLSATDSALTSTDDVTVIVNPATPQNQAPVVNAGTDQTITLPSVATLNGTVTDDGLPSPPAQVSITWSKVSGSGTVTFSSPNTAITTATFSQAGTYVLRLSATDSVLTSNDDVQITVNPATPQNQAPVVSAGTDQTITLPNGATLNGTVTDDGLPNPPAQINITWSKVSGSGTVTFSSPSTAVTSVTFSQAGIYVLRLSATDSALTSTDEVTVVVNPAQPNNTAPVVNAGQDQTITLPNVATLQGQVSDDGNPNPPGQLSITWTRVDGPGIVNFTNPNAVVTQASFAVAGTYTLRLTVSDSVLSTSDDVVIIANVTANQAPTVNAGVDQTILLPEIIILTATASDDGVPSSTLALTWSKVSGPGAVTFTDPSALSTSVVFDAAGVYRLKLTASDGQLTGSDEVMITLNTRKQITIYSHGYGFDPEELTVKAGDKSLMIRNRTGLEVTYVFTQGSQSLNVTALPGKTAIIDATLEVGTASLTAIGHSDWNCQVTIIP